MPRKKGRRVKKRTHGDKDDDGDGSANAAAAAAAAAATAPRSFVVHRGRVGRGAEALKTDLRDLLSPNTASKLRERRSSSLKDYIHVAGMYAASGALRCARTFAVAQNCAGGGGGGRRWLRADPSKRLLRRARTGDAHALPHADQGHGAQPPRRPRPARPDAVLQR